MCEDIVGCTFCIVSLTRSTPPSASSPSAYRGIEHLSKSTPHRLKERPETAQAPPRRPANAPKTPPIRQKRHTKHTPRRSTKPPKRPEDAPRRPQTVSKPPPRRLQDGSKTPTWRPLGSEKPWKHSGKSLFSEIRSRCTKTAQDTPKMPQDAPKTPSQRAQVALRR